MKRILTVLMAGAMAIGVMGATGCVVDDNNYVTCDNFDYYLATCTNCSVTYDCEYAYDSLSFADQDNLDYCSDCLADEADWGTCYDCDDLDGYSCHVDLEDLLGVNCAW